MSGTALREAVRDILRLNMGFTELECEATEGPEPPPAYSGLVFVSVHESDQWEADTKINYTIDERIGCDVTVSMRGNHVPMDRWAPSFQNNTVSGMEFLCRQIVRFVSYRFEVIQEADLYIARNSGKTAAQFSGFVEPLRFLRGRKCEKRGPAWWEMRTEGKELSGISRTLQFVNARRMQTVKEYI